MATGVENLLNYRGNAGLGSNSDIPVSDPNGNLNVINDIGKTSMLLNAERNAKIYQQKVKDRDTLIDLLASGKVASGEIDDQDRKVYDKTEQDQVKAFDAIEGVNDTKGIENYMKATNQLKNVTTHAQSKYILKRQLQDQLAKTTLPSEQEALRKHIDAQNQKDFWGQVDPYQNHLTFDHASMNQKLLDGSSYTSGPSTANIPGSTTQKTSTVIKGGVPVTTQTSTTGAGSKSITPAGAGGSSSSSSVSMETLTPLSTTEKSYDYNKILANSTDSYLHDEQIRHDQDQWRQSLENGDEYNAKKIVDFTNQKIGQYNEERGFTPGQNGYVTPIVVGRDVVQSPDGKFHLNMPTSEFSAKTALASVDGPYVQRQTDFNKDIGNYLLSAKKEKDANELGHARLAAQNRLNQAKIKALQPEDVTPFLKNQWIENIKGQPSGKGTYAGGKLLNSNLSGDKIPANQSMVLTVMENGKPTLLKPIGGKPVYQIGYMDGDKNVDKYKPNQERADKIVGYDGGYYTPVYFDNSGNRLSESAPAKTYGKYVKSAVAKGYKLSEIPKFDDYIKDRITDGTWKYGMQGADHLMTEEDHIGTQKAISNTFTKPKQQGIFTSIISESESGNTSQPPEE